MPRVVQPSCSKGSQRWLQMLINRQPEVINNVLRSRLGLSVDASIDWLSPLACDDYAEYRDDAFLRRLDIPLEQRALASFWPSNGPQWDALGKSRRGDLVLVEAKAHTSELISDCGALQPSLTLIQASLEETARFFKSTVTTGWSKTYYQYANRLAHLYLLRELNGLPAWLIFLYFTNADDVAGPGSKAEWQPAIEGMHTHLGLTPSQLGPHVVDVFLDVTKLASTGEARR